MNRIPLEKTRMKAAIIAWNAVLLFLLFGTAIRLSCLPRQESERKDLAKDDPSKMTRPQSQRRGPQEPRQSHLPSQAPLQTKPEPRIISPRQQNQHVDGGEQERSRQRQSPPGKPEDERNQNDHRSRELDKSRSRQPFDQQRGRQDGDNREGRNRERPGYHQDNWRDHHNDWQGRRARDWRSDHRTWKERGGYRGPRIPEYQFRQYFGPRHFFRLHDVRVLYFSGYPRFLYGGYWFSLVDPWPEYWADDWYETDDVYIAYGGDGYYMYNSRCPGVGVAVSISM